MLRKRLIFTLIYSDGFFCQSRNFNLQKVGDKNWLINNYNFIELSKYFDELIILDASRKNKDFRLFANNYKQIIDKLFMPISIGGGINSLDRAKFFFENGADKVVVNSSLQNKILINELVSNFGSQSIIASVDYKLKENKRYVFINDGNIETNIELFNYISYLKIINIGEIFLNSIDKDGSGFGYDLDVLNSIDEKLNLPIIISGGAGNHNHFKCALENDKIDAVSTANLFNFIGDGLKNARIKLKDFCNLRKI